MSGGPLPDDVHQGGEEGLHLVAEAVLGAQGLSHSMGDLLSHSMWDPVP